MTAELRTDAETYFPRLRELSQPLNDASDCLSREISRIEMRLEALNLGIAVWHRYAPNRAVGYAKIGNRWGLGICDDPTKQQYLFLDAPRERRIDAAEYIPGLLVVLANKADEVLASLQSSVTELRGLLS